MKSKVKTILLPALTVLVVTIAVIGGFLLGCECTIKSAVYVGPSYDLETKEPGYVISYRYGDYWTNHLYIEQ